MRVEETPVVEETTDEGFDEILADRQERMGDKRL
jgi:hypothetical protein